MRTRLTELLSVEHPIVQTGMGWVAGPRLVSATSNAGAFGILASATMTLEQLKAALDEVRTRTDKPFGVNLRTDVADVAERITAMVEAGAKAASFAQAPAQEIVKRAQGEGLVVIPTIGAPRHAEKMAALGVDAVIAQGAEGGGHTGAIPTSVLLPAVVDAVSIPVIGAGGFYDARGLKAALDYGAEGIAMGTRFLLSKESTVPDVVKARYLAVAPNGTVVTTEIDGVPQRVIRTEFVEHLEGAGRIRKTWGALMNARRFKAMTGATVSGLLREGRALRKSDGRTWSQVILAANAPMMTKAGLVDGDLEAGVLPTGQVAGLIDDLPSVAEIIEGIMGG